MKSLDVNVVEGKTHKDFVNIRVSKEFLSFEKSKTDSRLTQSVQAEVSEEGLW